MESLIVAWYIRSNLFRLHEWSVENTLPFNISKCHVTRFTREKSGTWFHLLRINDTPLDKRETTTDLGIALYLSLSSAGYITYLLFHVNDLTSESAHANNALPHAGHLTPYLKVDSVSISKLVFSEWSKTKYTAMPYNADRS